jgi:CheW-like protein
MYLTLRVANQRFAIEGKRVERVIDAEHILPIPRQAPETIGVVAYKGLLIPVFDLERLFDRERSVHPHLIIFYGKESLNAFPAEAMEGITEECLMTDGGVQHRFLDPLDVIYNDQLYHQLNFSAIEQHLNIP